MPVVLDGVPSVTCSAAFRGRKLVAEFQRALVLEYLALAGREARRFQGGTPLDELQGIAYEGLCVAAVRYEPSRGPFAPFAKGWIHRQLARAVQRAGLIVRPDRALWKAARLRADGRRMEQEAGRPLTTGEEATAAGLELDAFYAILGAKQFDAFTQGGDHSHFTAFEQGAGKNFLANQLKDATTGFDPELEDPIPLSPTGVTARILAGQSVEEIAAADDCDPTWARRLLLWELRAVIGATQ